MGGGGGWRGDKLKVDRVDEGRGMNFYGRARGESGVLYVWLLNPTPLQGGLGYLLQKKNYKLRHMVHGHANQKLGEEGVEQWSLITSKTTVSSD